MQEIETSPCLFAPTAGLCASDLSTVRVLGEPSVSACARPPEQNLQYLSTAPHDRHYLCVMHWMAHLTQSPSLPFPTPSTFMDPRFIIRIMARFWSWESLRIKIRLDGTLSFFYHS